MNELPLGPVQRTRVEEFQRRHRVGVVTLLFTDLVGFARLKQELGDARALSLVQAHHDALRSILGNFADGEEISTAGDAFFVVFAKPSDAVRFSLELQAANRRLTQQSPRPILDRIGIHAGEVLISEGRTEKDLFGLQVDTAARIKGLATGDQVLMTRFVFDNARHTLEDQDLAGLGRLAWLSHGEYLLKGVEEPMQVCEVGETGLAILKAPGDSEKAHRHAGVGELVLGWRPAVGQKVPGTQWVLEHQLGEGGFGEVWLGVQERLKEKRVFKFCFRADRVRSLKREVTLFRVLKERVGEHPNLVTVYDVFLDKAPYYLVTEYVPGRDLRSWHGERSLAGRPVTEAEIVEVVAQIANALQAAHDAGVIHRDIKPSNILVVEEEGSLKAKLTDFGIGQVVSSEVLGDMTKLGFTVTLAMAGNLQSGTHLYMAPEVVAGRAASPRSDLYSLGVVLYQLLSSDLTRPVTPEWADDISDPLLREDLRRCFCGKVDERYAGPGELARNLRALEARRREAAIREAETRARERAAYRRGVVRTTVFAGLGIAVLAFLAIYALLMGQRAWKAKRATTQANTRLTESQDLLQLKTAEGFFEGGDGRAGVACLADLLKRNPSNLIAAERLISALIYRPFPRLIGELRRTNEFATPWFSPDGQQVVSRESFSLLIWDARTGQPVGGPLQREGEVHNAVFSPDGQRVFTAKMDGTARVWNARTGQPIGEPLRHWDWGPSASFCPYGQWVVTLLSDNTAQVWDAGKGQPIGEPLQHETTIESASFSPDGRWVVTASRDEMARVWDVRTGHLIGEPIPHQYYVFTNSFSPNGQWLVTALSFSTARVWDARTGQPVSQPIRLRGHPKAVVFSPDGQWVLTTDVDEQPPVQIWDARTGHPVSEPFLPKGLNIPIYEFSPDAQTVFVSSDRFGSDSTNRLRIYDTRTGRPIGEPLQYEGSFPTASFSPDGRWVMGWALTCRAARVWDVRTGQPVGEPLRHHQEVFRAGFSPDGLRVVTQTGSAFESVVIWDTGTGHQIGEPLRAKDGVFTVSFSPDGQRMLTQSIRSHAVRIWDVRIPLRGEPLELQSSGFQAVPLSPDGQLKVTTSLDLTTSFDSAQVRDTRTGQPIGEPLQHLDRIQTVSFSPNGQRVVTASSDKTARVWDAQTGLPVGEPLRHGGVVHTAGFSPDGRRVVTASSDKTARVWDAQTGLPVGEPLRHESGLFDASFRDGQRVVTAESGVGGWIWDTPSPIEPVPGWFGDLVEKLVGAQYRNGVIELSQQSHTPASLAVQFAKELQGTSTYAHLLSWLFSDPSTRKPSPFSEATAQEAADQLIKRGTKESLVKVLGVCPTNALALTKLVFLLLKEHRYAHAHLKEADFFSRRALLYGSHEPEVWRGRNAVLAYLDHKHSQEALEAVEKAVKLGINDPALWQSLCELFKNIGLWEEAAACHRRLAAFLEASSTSNQMTRNANLLGDVRKLTIRARHARGISAREPSLGPSLIDLTSHYNAAFEDFHLYSPTCMVSFSSLPKGMQEIGGIRYDVRGIVQLGWAGIIEAERWYPQEVPEIPVNQSVSKLHFLHGCVGLGEEDAKVARYEVLYADGSSASARVIYGRNIRDCRFSPDMPEREKTGVTVAWRGPLKKVEQLHSETGVRLYRMTWDNPHPEKKIATIDLVSEMTPTAVFVIAITVE